LHIGYDGYFNDFSFLAAYDHLTTDETFEDDVTPTVIGYPIKSEEMISQSDIVTAELKYKYKLPFNSLVAGIKYRYKMYDFTKYKVNGNDILPRSNTSQGVATIFAENEYSIKENIALIGGLMYQDIFSKDALDNENKNLLMYRFGLTFIHDSWVFKTVASHSESMFEPYLIDSNYIVNGEIDPYALNSIYQDIVYQDDKSKYELMFGYIVASNYLLADASHGGSLSPLQNDVPMLLYMLRWSYDYNQYDKIFTEFSYKNVTDLPILIDDYEVYHGVLRSLNTYGKLDIFNEIIYDRDNIYKENYFDYSAGLKYNYTKDLVISFNAENILKKSKKMSYPIIDPTTFRPQDSLNISVIDRKATLSLEYTF